MARDWATHRGTGIGYRKSGILDIRESVVCLTRIKTPKYRPSNSLLSSLAKVTEVAAAEDSHGWLLWLGSCRSGGQGKESLGLLTVRIKKLSFGISV